MSLFQRTNADDINARFRLHGGIFVRAVEYLQYFLTSNRK
jgi:hypothetical protein